MLRLSYFRIEVGLQERDCNSSLVARNHFSSGYMCVDAHHLKVLVRDKVCLVLHFEVELCIPSNQSHFLFLGLKVFFLLLFLLLVLLLELKLEVLLIQRGRALHVQHLWHRHVFFRELFRLARPDTSMRFKGPYHEDCLRLFTVFLRLQFTLRLLFLCLQLLLYNFVSFVFFE